MRLILVLLLSSFTFLSNAQGVNVTVSGMIFNSNTDSVFISQFFGTHYEDLQGTKFKKDGSFKIETSIPNPDYYVLRFGKNHVNIILRDKSDIKVYGDGANFSEFVNIVGSAESENMNEYLKLANDWNLKSNQAIQAIQTNPTIKDSMNAVMANEFKRFQSQQKSFIQRHSNSAALFPVLSSIDPNSDFAGYESVVKQLNTAFPKSPTIQGIQKNYETLKLKRVANDPLAPGKLAPDFEENMVDGTTMRLSDLKGKVVLLDFWASWCGPCRRENPAVVNLYNKYKDDGFTVMSVSLDKSKEKWVAAIEKDNLSWPYHVSDLAQWSSKVAKLYGVRGIPFTVLIDQEGKIVKTKLRGAALGQELARIYGH